MFSKLISMLWVVRTFFNVFQCFSVDKLKTLRHSSCDEKLSVIISAITGVCFVFDRIYEIPLNFVRQVTIKLEVNELSVCKQKWFSISLMLEDENKRKPEARNLIIDFLARVTICFSSQFLWHASSRPVCLTVFPLVYHDITFLSVVKCLWKRFYLQISFNVEGKQSFESFWLMAKRFSFNEALLS